MMTSPPTPLPDFDTPELAKAVEALPADALNALPFGAIRLDRNGVVQTYSEAERRLSGFSHEAVGRDFFTDMAPCMNTPHFRGRIERGRLAGRLDIEFGHTGDFADRTRMLRVRVQSAGDGGYWIFMQREAD